VLSASYTSQYPIPLSHQIGYPVIGEPPLLAGGIQEIVIDVELKELSIKAVGGSGTVEIVKKN
jgi:hypothetical protein